MMRLAAWLASIFCFVIVLAEGLGLGLLWMRGQLTPETLQEIRLTLSSDHREADVAKQDEEQELPSSQDIIAERALRIMDIESRERELGQLKTLVTESRALVLQEHADFTKQKKDFEQQLRDIDTQLASKATELSREILAQSEAKDAVQHLMALDLQQDVILVSGLSEKKIAELLKEFGRGDAEQMDRGLKIFEALANGDPNRKLVRNIMEPTNPNRDQPEG